MQHGPYAGEEAHILFPALEAVNRVHIHQASCFLPKRSFEGIAQ